MWLEAWGKIRTQITTRRLSLQGWGLGVDMTIIYLPWWCILFASGLYLWYPHSSCSASVRDLAKWTCSLLGFTMQSWNREEMKAGNTAEKSGREKMPATPTFFFLTRLSLLESKRSQRVSHLVTSRISRAIGPYQRITNVNTVHVGRSSSSQYL